MSVRWVFMLLVVLLLASKVQSAPQLLAKINAALPKLNRHVGGLLVASIIACNVLTGCDYGSSRSVLDVIGEKREGDENLSIFVDGVWWFGYQGGSVGYLRSQVADESGVITFRQTLSGFVGEALSDHPDIGAQVWLDHDDYRWFGTVVTVFDTNLNWNEKNDLYQISVEDWLYLGEGDSMPPTATPRFILAYPRDGADAEGFVIAEEADDAQ